MPTSRDRARRLARSTPPPNANVEAHLHILRHLLHLLSQFQTWNPRPSTPAEDQQQANGWGLPCPRDHAAGGCPVAAGWEEVAMRHLMGEHRHDSEPTLWRPFSPDAPLGPPPPCYRRYVRAWYGHDLAQRS